MKLQNHKTLIQELLNEGHSAREISRRLGVNVTTITRYIQKNGLTIRKNFRWKPVESIVNTLIEENQLKIPIDLKKICKKLDISIKEMDFDEELSGILAKNTIYISQNIHLHRQRFTIAHELGHYLIHKKQDNSYKGVRFRSQFVASQEKKEEREANVFASLLLMPTQFLEEDLQKKLEISEEFVMELSQKYQVSPIAMTIRIEKMGYAF